VNPEEQQDLEDVFGKAAVTQYLGRVSDRRAEGYARRKRSTLPDMRKGEKAGQYRFVPADPQASFGEGGGRGAAAGESDRPSGRKGSRDRFREPRVEPVKRQSVTVKGKRQTIQGAYTLDQHKAKVASVEAENAAGLEAARMLEEATKNAPLALPISETPPRRFRSVDAEVRRYAAETVLRGRPRPEPLDLFARDGILKFSDVWEVCGHCGKSPCELSWDTDEKPDTEEPAPDPRDEYDGPYYDDARYGTDGDDRSQWEIDHSDAIAEDAAAAEAKRLAAEVTSPPDEPDDRCIHCGIDPIRTQKDGLCRWCKTTKKKTGNLPTQKMIDSRRRRREEGF
jgi:hypothetical protein